MPGQCFQMGSFAIDEMQHQKPAEHQLVPMGETGLQHPQALRHKVG
jgi:hypothetical protein